MDTFQLSSLLFTLLVLFNAFFSKRWLNKSPKKNLPPSPPTLPIIGNLHQLGNIPHRAIWKLSRKYGPVMLLHFGSRPTLVVSSAKGAEEVMRTNDPVCADKPVLSTPKRIFYDLKDLINLPYGDEWRKIRSIFVQELLNSRRVKSYEAIREEETASLVAKIKQACLTASPVDLTHMFMSLTNDKISRAAFGMKFSETERGRRFLRLMDEAVSVLFKFNIGELVPWLAWTNRLNGFDAEVDGIVERADKIMESVIREHLERKDSRSCDGESGHGETFMDILIGLYKGHDPGKSIDKTSVKAVIVDVFGAGTETSATTLGWAMTELIRHPTVMKKLQDEVRHVLNGKPNITDEDLVKMPYLKAVIKETFRYHPPLPIYFRYTREDVNLMGYDIEAHTMVLINAWAIGRDPASWEDPDKFMPERFLNSSIDFRGFNFQLVPFGAGRRICPGLAFATTSIEHVLANLTYKFDWGLPNGTRLEDLDSTERPGFTVGRNDPLIVVPTKSYF